MLAKCICKELLICFLVLFPFFAPSALKGQTTETQNKKVVSATVIYGNDFLLENLHGFSAVELTTVIDSLKNSPSSNAELLKQLQLFVQLKTNQVDDVYEIIDSLFELNHIPYALINELNRYVLEMENTQFMAIDSNAPPANHLYSIWQNRVPFAPQKINTDTTYILHLITDTLGFVMPIENTLTSPFGWRDGRMHKGIDLDLNVWDPVKSCFSGKVRLASTYGGYGRVVIIRHYNGLETLYAHLHRIKVKPGDIVQAGQIIGLGGSSGKSTGSHLHFEVRFQGQPINPLVFIDHKKNGLVSDKLFLKQNKKRLIAFPDGSLFHTVKSGDYLFKIANQYGVSISKICQINGIQRNSKLVVGQTLRII